MILKNKFIIITAGLLVIILGIAAVMLHKRRTATTNIILGYYTVYDSGDQEAYHSLLTYGSYMNQLSVGPFIVTSTGTIEGTSATEAMLYANGNKIRTFATITNQTNGSFDPNLSHLILVDPANRKFTISQIHKLILDNGYNGANIDFENMPAADRPFYTSFIKELAETLHSSGYTLIVSVMAKTTDSPTSSWIGAFDYASLGQLADQLQIMTYDEHDPSGEPGPIAGYPWVNEVIQYAVSQIPTTKILLGLAAYGYDWHVGTENSAESIAWNDIPDLISTTGAKPKWDQTSRSPYFTYSSTEGDHHTVWYENKDSIQSKIRLVSRYKLGGISMWSMGFEDGHFWKAVVAGLTK